MAGLQEETIDLADEMQYEFTAMVERVGSTRSGGGIYPAAVVTALLLHVMAVEKTLIALVREGRDFDGDARDELLHLMRQISDVDPRPNCDDSEPKPPDD